MDSSRIKVLYVDDDEDDYIIARDHMSEVDGMEFDLEWVGSYNAAIDATEREEYDIYLVDYSLGARNGLELMQEMMHRGCKGPIILLTGQGDHEIDLEAMKMGAADYLVKEQITTPLLGRSIRYAIERFHVLEALRDSETQYKRLFRDNPLPMWLYDMRSLHFLAVNDAAVRGYRYSREEFLRMTVNDIELDGDSTSPHREAPRAGTERGITSKARHQKKDGTIIDVEVTCHDLSFAGSQARLVMANDITQRKRVEDALRKSEEHFRSLTENALDLIQIIDSDGVIRYHSSSSERVTGYKSQHVTGRSALDFVHSDDVTEYTGAVKKMNQDPGAAVSFEFRFHHRDGSWRKLEAIGRRPPDDSVGGGIIINSRDITERETLQAQLIQSEKLAALGRLVSGVAHELNNPLTSVIGYTQLALSQGGLSEELRENLETVHAQGQRARRIVQNMLSFARQHKPARSTIEINSLIDVTLELRAYEMSVNNVNVIRRFGDVDMILGDPHLLQQVFLNILVNAEQAIRSFKGAGTLTVTTEPSERDGCQAVKVTIADDGPGIPPDVIGRVFDPFFTTKGVGEGTGLGLSISFGIVKEHGGSIRAESRLDGGASFILELPTKPIA